MRILALMAQRQFSRRGLPDELPRLLDERKITLRSLAREVGGFDHGYLSRMLSHKTPVNALHAERIALHLGLPAYYFPEAREAAVIKAVRRSARLRDAIYFERVRRRS